MMMAGAARDNLLGDREMRPKNGVSVVPPPAAAAPNTEEARRRKPLAEAGAAARCGWAWIGLRRALLAALHAAAPCLGASRHGETRQEKSDAAWC